MPQSREYSAALEGTPNPDPPPTSVWPTCTFFPTSRTTRSLRWRKPDAIPNLNPAVKNVAKNVKDRAEKVKAGTMKVPSNTGNAPAQVEIKK